MTILNTEPIMVEPAWCFPVFIVLVVIAILFFIMALFNGENIVGCIFVILFLIAIYSAIFIKTTCAPEPSPNRNRYEVILDDTVPAREIYEKYNIIEKRGDIWILEDKAKDEHDD